MKRISRYVTIGFLLVLVLTNCQSLDRAYSSDNEDIRNLSRFLSYDVYEWNRLLSPDGMWLAQDSTDDENILKVFRTDQANFTLTDDGSEETGLGKTIISWSPDSKNFTVSSSSNPGICHFDRVVIYHIQENRELSYSIFQPPDHSHDCYGVAWSPDSSMMAISDNKGNIFFVDLQGSIIRKFAWKEQAQISVYWTNQGIFANISKYDSEINDRVSSIIWFENQESEEYQTVFENDFSIGIHGFDPQIEKILIGVGKQMNEEDRLRLWVFDIKTKKVIKELYTPGYVFENGIDPLYPNAISYLLEVPKHGGERKLMLFDWATTELVDVGHATHIIGWRSNVDGYITLVEKNGEMEIQIVH